MWAAIRSTTQPPGKQARPAIEAQGHRVQTWSQVPSSRGGPALKRTWGGPLSVRKTTIVFLSRPRGPKGGKDAAHVGVGRFRDHRLGSREGFHSAGGLIGAEGAGCSRSAGSPSPSQSSSSGIMSPARLRAGWIRTVGTVEGEVGEEGPVISQGSGNQSSTVVKTSLQ